MDASIDPRKLKQILEAALFASDEPLGVERLVKLFAHGELDSEEGRAQIRATLDELAADAEGRGYELQRVASGWRYQVRQQFAEWVGRLWEEKPPRYSRALLETLALIAYRQPVTRGDIEDLRGVAVSQNIMRTLLERNWIRVVGEREVPGRPSLYGTTKAFLDYFNLKSLDQLPPLPEIRALIETMVIEEPLPEADARAATPAAEADEEDREDARTADETSAAAGDRDAETSADAADLEPIAIEATEGGPAGEEQASDFGEPQRAEVLILPQPPRQ